jgi:hypothetical protein
MTQYDKIRIGKGADKKYLHYKDIVPLAKLDDIVFGSWDVYPQNAYQSAMYAEVLKEKDINPVRDELEKIVPMKAAFDKNYAKRLDGDNVKDCKKDGGFGDNKTIILENCVSYKNGFLDENTIASNGNGNGFKMGSDQGAMNVFLNRCIAVCNKAKGFDQNHNAGDIIMNNCTGMTLKSICGDKAYSYRIYESIASGHQVALTNCIAINDNAATDKIDSKTKLPKVGEDGKYGLYGRFEVDSTLTGMTIKTCDFRHADPTQFVSVTNYIDLIGERDDTGNLKDITFAHLVGNSPLIDAGTKIEAATYRGLQVNGIAYSGTAPDLGAYEYQSAATGISNTTGSESNGQSLSINATQSGILLLTVKGADPAGQFTANVFSQTGAQLGAHSFHGCTTAITIPATASGVCLIKVTGEGYAQTAKVVVK